MPASDTLLIAVCDFGWGSLGKLRLILDELPSTDVILFGDTDLNAILPEMLGHRHAFVRSAPEAASAALVINDPVGANRVAALGPPVVYVDSLPYLWANDDEVPMPGSTFAYCAQKFPERLPVSKPLRDRPGIHWIDPIIPSLRPRRGGHGTVISLGGLHSHAAGDAVNAYLNLVLLPLVEELRTEGRTILGVCGNLPTETCRVLAEMLPECRAIGRQSPYEFEGMLERADLLIASPGSTTILQAAALNLPTMLLPPQNLSQILNAELYSWAGAPLMRWPDEVMTLANVERLRPLGENAVLNYIYGSVCAAVASPALVASVTAAISRALRLFPAEGVLDRSLSRLGVRGASQVARLVRQVMDGNRLRRREPAIAAN